MTEPTELLPCPFCGSSNVVHYEVEGRDNHHFECCNCLASSMCKTTRQEALAAWNLRTPQPTQAQAGAVPLYRLLQSGVDRIEAGDEFLSDDTTTWAIDPNGIFVGNIYGGHVLRPARRRIKGADHVS